MIRQATRKTVRWTGNRAPGSRRPSVHEDPPSRDWCGCARASQHSKALTVEQAGFRRAHDEGDPR